ncbi:hypothetical protein C8256_13975 [Kluyvera genomosp. 2]|uniref:Uncharacterized protein n=1 Tax=Kluyvera genomosp. 2 TaxID=2774054 RepID=A0A2T2Y0S8_9ENTR|nr:hypothetical protein C8256_13975 [Kluyvera genomosp. 2]
MFTQNFFTDNAIHKQNCTSFNPKRVITYNVNNGKPFLNASRSAAQIPTNHLLTGAFPPTRMRCRSLPDSLIRDLAYGNVRLF